MAKCKVCGVQIPRGEVLCHACAEEIKHKRSEAFTTIPPHLVPKIVPPDTSSNVKPADNPVLKVELSDEYMHNHMEEAMNYAKKTMNMKGEFLVDTQEKIKAMLGGMCDLLLYKNHKYGDSALKPLGIFTKHIKNCDESTASIIVRLDDKLSRVRNADSLRTNDVADILGYCTLLLISMGVTREDLAKFMD